ncbi:hypothetical protein HOM50_01200 [bacterium]|jgi:hypothetical protein|nr:hypothetical protein [bacterium]MBT5015007.1 hypothetical protein [bacterium]
MKKLFILVGMIVFNACSVDQPIDLVQQGEYLPALTLYKDQDKSSADWFNMGLCAYHEEKLDLACASWLVAYHQAYFNNDTKLMKAAAKNLTHVLEEMDEAPGLPTSLFLLDTGQPAFGLLPFWLWCVLSLSLFIFLCLVVVVWGPKKRPWLILGVICWFLLLIPMVTLYKLNNVRRGIITEPVVNLLSGPNNTFASRVQLRCCDQGVITQQRDGWCLLHAHTGKGWVPEGSLVQVGYSQ